MKVSEFAALCGAKIVAGEGADREIKSGYTCDLLSHVMGKGVMDMAWITVQTHMNVVAVASLLDFSCVIIPEGITVDDTIIEKANEEEIAILLSDKNAYELVSVMNENGIPAAKK
ncbi:MAG: AraC family transcriptional regulator [Clostridiales bacterium]|nr:AraC family transcriptional regulator [Clostridiales bacterium]MBQ2818076.1 AraC family transcriptional regulator [Clostridia bacterium]MBQ4638265.1 AraC family transcriptional regulator [Clostridia bacterium]